MSPLVSVLMPCHNAARTLPMALASLIAQTYQNWECVIVDDGSTDKPEEIVAASNDPRIRYFRLLTHQGGGVARQVTLDKARGNFIAILDADDWYYPEKLATQVEAIANQSRIAVVSAGMAIVDQSNDLIGVRCAARCADGSHMPPMALPAMPPIAFGPVMIRTSFARKAGFDPTFFFAQDADFLLRILLEEAHYLLPDVLYAYTEFETVSLRKVLHQHRSVRRMFWKYWSRFPFVCTSEIGKSALKSMVYRVGFCCGLKDNLIRRRSSPPAPQELIRFQAARSIVTEKTRALFGRMTAITDD